jgi:hypothetical protein
MPSSESELRVEKARAEAIVTLSNGDSVHGWFFVSGGSARHAGPERVGDLLNGETGFFPFEIDDGGPRRTVLYHRRHVVTVGLGMNAEARLDPGYEVAKERTLSLVLTTGRQLVGKVRIHCPEQQDRLSDWARSPELFRYLETGGGTFLVNAAYIVEVHEALDHE